jgi:hypothetical protein
VSCILLTDFEYKCITFLFLEPSAGSVRLWREARRGRKGMYHGFLFVLFFVYVFIFVSQIYNIVGWRGGYLGFSSTDNPHNIGNISFAHTV